MGFKDAFKATLEDSISDIDQKHIDLTEQSWYDAVYEVIKNRMKEGGGFKLNVGFGVFTVSPNVKADNTNISFEPSKEFKKIVEGEDEEMIIDDLEYIEIFDTLLTQAKIKTVQGLSAAMLATFGEAIARDGRSHLAEEKWYNLEVPKIGTFKFGYFEGDIKLGFEADKELKQLVKNYGL